MAEETTEFLQKISQQHHRINPCFMTGKGCVHTELIDHEISLRKAKNNYIGFLVVPFQPNLSAFLELCFKRYLHNSYQPEPKRKPPVEGEEKLDIIRADQVRRTGYVICEKICRKIQECDFVVADISVANANVFYELGLAYGTQQKILVIYHKGSEFGAKAASYFADGGLKAYPYEDLTPLEQMNLPLSTYVWQPETRPAAGSLVAKILFLERFTPQPTEPINQPRDIKLSFKTHVIAAIGVAIDNIVNRIGKSDKKDLLDIYKAEILAMKVADSVMDNERFSATLQRVQNAFCMILRTGLGCDPISYFWLGYCHALGKNVIPITVLPDAKTDMDDLAFDIRALWHMTFLLDQTEKFATELEEILHQMIITDFAEWSRKGFWDDMLGRRGKVSIFTGALHNDDIGREMIGDWDLRAASELTSFFASRQYRAVIESPVYQIEKVVSAGGSQGKGDYINGLEDVLRGKNCVIIASPDVNPLTELVLGKIYHVPKSYWFSQNEYSQRSYETVVAVKEVKPKKTTTLVNNAPPPMERFFYREEEPSTSGALRRGFRSPILPEQRIMGEFVSQTEEPIETFELSAHLLVVRNPFSPPEESRFIIVLNGVSGPATFALTHVLTGGLSKEFVSYGESFKPDSECEKILQRILKELNTAKTSGRVGLQCFFVVTVGKPIQGQQQAMGFADWRRIKMWTLVEPPGLYEVRG